MSTPILHKYSVYCTVEATYVDTEYSTDEPTVCPNNNAHPISTIILIDTVDTNKVIIDDNIEGTNGIYEARTRSFDIPAVVGVYETTFLTSPILHRLLMVQVMVGAANIGDSFDLIASPNTICGSLTADVNIGDTIVPVSTTVVNTVRPGFLISIDSSNDELGRCVVVDVVNETLSLETPLAAAYVLGTPVKFGLNRVAGLEMVYTGHIDLGSRNKNLMALPENTEMLLRYNNRDGLAKRFHVMYETYY